MVHALMAVHDRQADALECQNPQIVADVGRNKQRLSKGRPVRHGVSAQVACPLPPHRSRPACQAAGRALVTLITHLLSHTQTALFVVWVKIAVERL